MVNLRIYKTVLLLFCGFIISLFSQKSVAQIQLLNLFDATNNGLVPNAVGTITGTKVLYDNAGWGSANAALTTKSLIASTTSNSSATTAWTMTGGYTNALVGASDVTLTINNTAPLWNANMLQSRVVRNTEPTNLQVLTWVAANNDWEPTDQLGGTNWLMIGNGNATSSNILGTTNDVPMNIASNNTTMLQVGLRGTLGLYDGSSTGLYPYNQQYNPVMYIAGGTSGVAALQFQADGAQFYKPLFFTDADGNFMMRGSAAGTDFFELGSAGSNNAGQVIFTIGDDGDEPMIFRKYTYSTTPQYTEMMRLQGLVGNNTAVRAGINMNGSTANSTFQVAGSVSYAINTITANTTLDETYYTVLITNTSNFTITLPTASTCTGRVYIIKKTGGTGTITISPAYNNDAGSTTGSLTGRFVIQLQSNGSGWYQIN